MQMKRILTAIVSGALLSAGAWADQAVKNVRFGVDGNRTRVVIETAEPADFRAFTLDGFSDRLVVDLPQSDWAVSGLESGEGIGHGLVEAFRFFNNSSDSSRVVFELDHPAVIMAQFALDPARPGGNHRLVVDMQRSDSETFETESGFRRTRDLGGLIAERVEAVYVPPARERRVIVIDPGHGGHDPGALSGNGTREENVTLAAAQELRRQLLATGRYEVLLTRDHDEFLTLQQRVQVAADARADLFLSVHADSIPGNRNARGAAVYTLNDRAESRARRRALEEANHSRQADVNNILVSLELREKRNQSSAFAEVLLEHLGRAGPLLSNPHRQENFFVLLDSRVPAVLLEMGFLSNSADERNLNSSSARTRQMRAVVSGIDAYFERRGDDEDGPETYASLRPAP